MDHIVALSVGRDPLLLETRSQVLRRAGYSVVSALSIEEAVDHFRAGYFDIVILCHSVPLRDRELLTKAIHSHSPKTPVVVVAARLGAIDSFADAMVENEPATLLQQIPKLLCKEPAADHGEHKQA